MSIREKVIDYSRGNNLNYFWRLYGLQQRAGEGIVRDILTFMMSRCAHKHGGYIGPDTLIEGRPSLPHGLHGIFISRYARIGENCRIYQNVTIGEVDGKAPTIGDNCLIGAGAVIIGDVWIGRFVKIGAGAVVNTDVPDGCTVVSQPARIKESQKGNTDRAWIEINIANLQHNVKILQNAMMPGCKLMAVVKAGAYGHGAKLISTYLNQMGVRAFAVATLEEGISLRESGIVGEILILGYTNICRAALLQKYDLTQTLISFEYAKALNDQGIAVKAHIKIDTGMHRLGIDSGDSAAVIQIFAMKNLRVCGIYTHLCCADSREPEDVDFTRGQIGRFYKLIYVLRDSSINLPPLHIQSSYGFWNYPELSCDYVRAGIALYGVHSAPDNNTKLRLDLRPVLALKSRVVLIRSVKKGDSIGYDRSFIAQRDTKIAILPVGYGDGYPRSLSDGKGKILLNGRAAPVAGRICMDQLMVDITNIEGVSVGDVAVLIGSGEHGEMAAPAVADVTEASVVADAFDSISNELLCRLGTRLPVVITGD